MVSIEIEQFLLYILHFKVAFKVDTEKFVE
jgi:hypothetical protein